MSSETLYPWLKALHVFAVVVFVGNILVTAVWKILADRTQDRTVIEFAQRLVVLTDWIFTGPAAALLLVSGLVNAAWLGWGAVWKGPLWLVGGLLLFVAAGIVWAGVLIPVQIRQSRLLAETRGRPLPPGYLELCRTWTRAGLVTNLLPIVALVLMVLKPA